MFVRQFFFACTMHLTVGACKPCIYFVLLEYQSMSEKTPLDLKLVKSQTLELINDIKAGTFNPSRSSILYKYIYDNVNTLYTMVITSVRKDLNTNTFNQKKFMEKLDEMIELIGKIQKNSETQHSASIKVGEKLAKEFIPSSLLKKS